MRKKTGISRRLKVAIRFIKFRVLGLDDSPNRIALGVALGLFVALMPIYGLHIITVLALSFLLRANKLAALTAIFVTNPLTAVPIYYCNYLIGRKILLLFGQPAAQGPVAYRPGGFSLTGVFDAELWCQFGTWVLKISAELWVGCLIMGFVTACGGYLASLYLVRLYRSKHPHNTETKTN